MNVLKPLINELVKLVKAGTNLAKQELPVVAKEILRFYFWASFIWVVTGLVLILAGLFCHIHAIPAVVETAVRHYHDADNDPSCGWIFGAVIGYLVGVAIVIINMIDIVKIKAAPRLFLLEYLKGFLDSGE